MRFALVVALVAALAACDRGGVAPPAAPAASGRAPEVVRREGNHLVGQASPYLEQHAHNPVDWYPWGAEAFAKARAEKKPIFVSIGYATCHWCHVMEKESFEDDATARLLNERFVAIKVDREERPDVDALYLDAVAALGGSTGWPLNVVLTPDLEPYFGGTYFPREARGGRASFGDVLRKASDEWRDHGSDVTTRGKKLLEAIAASGRAGAVAGDADEAALRDAFTALARSRDDEEGGFGRGAKFPNAPALLAELRWARRGDASARTHLVKTLEKMAGGGVRDLLAGSFHRYAVDRAWRVPHFEKTLYDNAQLAPIYVEAGLWLGRDDLVTIGRRIADDLVAGWWGPDGGLVVGFDADDAGGEGAYSTWTPAELAGALGAEDGAAFARELGVTPRGDPGLDGRSVLAPGWGAPSALRERALPKLRAVRDRRPRPATDDKELAGWNGLAIAGLAELGRWLDEPRYVEAAERAARFVLERCWRPELGMLRGVRRGVALGDGVLEDYALVGLGLLRLHEADGDLRWLEAAAAIGSAAADRFFDDASGTFLGAVTSQAAPGLPLARADYDDGPLPSGGAAATLLAAELGDMGDARLASVAEASLAHSAGKAKRSPMGGGATLVALDRAVASPREVVVAGAPDQPKTRALRAEIGRETDARITIVLLPTAGAPAALAKTLPALDGKLALKGEPTAYVCSLRGCMPPARDPASLRRALGAK